MSQFWRSHWRAGLPIFLMLVTLSHRTAIASDAAVRASRVPWARYDAEIVSFLQQYLRIDTSNPPGHESLAVDFLTTELLALGLAVQRFTVAEGRENLVATLKGDGSNRPLILTHHMDVVGVEASDWKQPPFSGVIKDGEIWGRGALDMKATGIVHLMVLKILKEQDTPLTRDIIFVALADEEADSLGARDLVTNHPEVVKNAEFLINEGATPRREDGRTTYYAIDTMEKASLWLKLVAKGPGGHGSAPLSASAINRLTAAIERINTHPMPIMLSPSVESYFATMSDKALPNHREKLKHLRCYLGDEAFAKELTSDPMSNALLRSTVAVTGLKAGSQVNVIPTTAEALLDCRLLPGQDKSQFLAALKATIADDSIQIEETSYVPGNESPLDTALVSAIKRVAARRDPDVPVFPLPLVSTTDSSFFRTLGIHAYGFEPFRLTKEEELLGHAANERISIEELRLGLRFLLEVVLEVATR